MLRPAASPWLSDNPGKAHAERFFLLYTPVWIAAIALIQITGVMMRFGDAGYLLFSSALCVPLAIPVLRPHALERHRAWHERYAFKFLVWMWVFGWVGNYFFSHYFFDILGMRYAFPIDVNLDAAIAGEGRGQVPFIMFLLTLVYFCTYHTLMTVVLRRIRRALQPNTLALALIILVLSYGVAFAETFTMANPILEDFFWYEDRDRMLAFGSIFYACYFIVSLPMVYRLDEDPAQPWPLSKVLLEVLAASMLVFIILDAWALVLGPI